MVLKELYQVLKYNLEIVKCQTYIVTTLTTRTLIKEKMIQSFFGNDQLDLT